MVQKGARHLIVPSRSGMVNDAAIEAVNELSQQGVTIVTPACDVSSLDLISQAIEKYSKSMSQIRGCINATMVLQVRL